MTPAAQAAAQQRQQAQAARRKQLNGIEAEWTTDRSNYDRCISTGVLNSITPKIYNSGSRIVQGPGWLAFQNEMIHETRVIPTDGRKKVGAAIKNWMGTSVGRWEGDVLVVETRNIKPESPINGQPLSDEGVLIERFTLADANTLDYRMTVNDPKVYTAPWTMRMPIPREDELRLLRVRRATKGTTRCPTCSPARAPKRSAAPKRRRAARRFPSTSNRRVAAAPAAVLARVVAAAAVAEITKKRIQRGGSQDPPRQLASASAQPDPKSGRLVSNIPIKITEICWHSG